MLKLRPVVLNTKTNSEGVQRIFFHFQRWDIVFLQPKPQDGPTSTVQIMPLVCWLGLLGKVKMLRGDVMSSNMHKKLVWQLRINPLTENLGRRGISARQQICHSSFQKHTPKLESLKDDIITPYSSGDHCRDMASSTICKVPALEDLHFLGFE